MPNLRKITPMIDLSNFDESKLLKGLDAIGDVAKQTENILNGINIDEVKKQMTPKQFSELTKAKSQLEAINKKDWNTLKNLAK